MFCIKNSSEMYVITTNSLILDLFIDLNINYCFLLSYAERKNIWHTLTNMYNENHLWENREHIYVGLQHE